MSVKVGINGFGRMGRLFLRAAWARNDLEFVQVNETACGGETSVHLLKFDSIHGTWERLCRGDPGQMIIDGRAVKHSSTNAIGDVDWSGCDIVIESTGIHHKQPELLNGYFEQGVKKVLVAAPTEGALNIVYGINHMDYDPNRHNLVTAASCTTNCLAPVVKVMHEQIGILRGSITTIHGITNTQTILDSGHKDLRRARACGQSLIPTTTGSAKAITKIFPELDGKLNGHAIRVPVVNASITDFVFEAARAVTADEVNTHFRAAAAGELEGILGYEEQPLVSIDYLNDPRSSIVDALSTLVVDDTHVKIYAWYDNEWGYVCRMADIASMLAARL